MIYRGRVTVCECITLNREPNNKHDRNAIRVDNVMGQTLATSRGTRLKDGPVWYVRGPSVAGLFES